MDLKKLGEEIQQKREALGLPVTTVANRAGIGRTTLWKVERGEDSRTGKPSRLSKDKLERLLSVLGMSHIEQTRLLCLAGYVDDLTASINSAQDQNDEKIFTGAYFFPSGEDLEIDLLLEELRQVLQDPSLTKEKRKEMIALIHSFISWLKFRNLSSR